MSQDAVEIRLASVADARAIAKLHVRAWQWAYRGLIDESYLDRLSATLDRRIESYQAQLPNLPPQNRWWVAEHAGRLLGFAMTGPCHDGDASPATGEVFAIYLERDAAGKGIGRALFSRAVDELRRQGFKLGSLWVLESNRRARRFYEAAGWSPDGTGKTEELPGGTRITEVRYRFVL